MPVLERSVLLPHPAWRLRALVEDVASYPAFLPGCTAARVLRQEATVTEAELAFRVAGIEERFATENRRVPGTDEGDATGGERVQMRLLRGPFKRLTGEWRFQPLGEAGCKVSLRVDLELGPRLLQGLVGASLERAVGEVIAAFRARAMALSADG